MTEKLLSLNFHGRVIDHLGIQMYQSPTAAIAEMISNSWDADAEEVNITLPTSEDAQSSWKIVISDNGHGMTFEECQRNFLTVGFDKRNGDAKAVSREKARRVMGRKGIGKFAGFGISSKIEVDTISKLTGEHTIFTLDLNAIRNSDKYVDVAALNIKPSHYASPDPARIPNHGTKITLKSLSLGRRIPIEQFMRSMARRFVINRNVDLFSVKVNSNELPSDEEMTEVEFSFPKDFTESEKPEGMSEIENGWATEKLPSGHLISWRVLFKKDTIKEDEHKGVAVFAHNKLAQRPCMFNLAGGLSTQTGPEYMAGAVVADFIDELDVDVISTERQRLNWEHKDLEELQDWGQARIKFLLSLWKKRRGEAKLTFLNTRVSGFRARLDALGFESKTVESALRRLASIEKISAEQFSELGNAILTAWEGGRLKHLIHKMSETSDMNETDLLRILIEADTIQALHTSESVRAKLEAIRGLERRIKDRELENAVRDYISRHPWLISPQWETFAVEKRVQGLISTALDEAKRHVPASAGGEDPFDGRVDLVLSSGSELLVMEFMRPGLKMDLDHLNRFEAYINTIIGELEVNTGLGFKKVSGYIVADKINKAGSAVKRKILSLEENQMRAFQWNELLEQSKHQWREFLDQLVERAPDDPRMMAIKNQVEADEKKSEQAASQSENLNETREHTLEKVKTGSTINLFDVFERADDSVS